MNAWMVSQLLSPAKVVGQLAYPKKKHRASTSKGGYGKIVAVKVEGESRMVVSKARNAQKGAN